jgi:hypothetical protein
VSRPVGPAPMAFTDTEESCGTGLGLSPRQFRHWLRTSGVPCARIGKRTIARADVVLAAIDAAAGTAPRPAWSEDATIEAAARGSR